MQILSKTCLLKLQDVFITKTGRHLLGVSLVTRQKSKTRTVLKTQNAAENTLHAQNYESTSAQSFCNCHISATGHKKKIGGGGSRLSPAQTTAKVNQKLHSHQSFKFQ